MPTCRLTGKRAPSASGLIANGVDALRKSIACAVLLVSVAPAVALAQGPTQGRDGMGAGSSGQVNTGTSPNSLPAGSSNAATGPQAQPAYPSGSTTPNPGAAMVATQPVPATGPLQSSPGSIATTTVTPGGGTQTRSGGPGVGEAATPAR